MKNIIHNLSISFKKLDKNILFIFIIYAFLRLFLKYQAYWIWGDEARHLECAKTFPFNLMYNHSFFDLHPVFYPYTIRLFSVFFKDHIAAIAVSFFSSLVLFFTSYKLFRFLNLSKKLIYIALTYMVFNDVLFYFSKIPFRYELFVAMFILSFYLYLKGITTLKTGYLCLAGLFGGLSYMTSDVTSFMLLPAMAGAFFVFGFKKLDPLITQLKKLIPIFVTALIYVSCVLLPRFLVYSTHKYYPTGMGGRIEDVSNFGLKQLLSPVNFANGTAVWGKIVLRADLGFEHMKNMLFTLVQLYKYDDPFYNWVILIFMSAPIVIMLYKIFSGKAKLKAYKVDLFLFLLILGICYPLIYAGAISRYSIAAVPFLAYFLAKGCSVFLAIEKKSKFYSKRIFKYAFLIALLILTGTIMKKSHYFIFTIGRIEQSDKAAAFMDTLPKDGVLAEGLIGDSLAYHTKKRVVLLPRSADEKIAKEQTDLSISEFDLNYVVISEFWRTETGILAYPAVDYIKNTPSKFRLIKTIYENYDTGVSSNKVRNDDTFYIYEIVKENLKT